ncbi:unnamed protein product [Ceutorhynchus assimilis]|uniref:Uncharacterized protein n=1 Tax=Ceutorhynchus assimilis TaxID=467358 RepID=A0A9N9MBM8_9CUCU|nr:unnamed protein product [Ceutorhynchus assimilis]
MYQAGKAANLVKEAKRLQINILGCSDTRWPNSGHCIVNQHYVFFSGESFTKNKNGVAIILEKPTNEAVIGFTPISSKVALIKMNAKPFDINVIQSYAPTSESSEQEIEEFYEHRTALKKREVVNIFLEDMNA